MAPNLDALAERLRVVEQKTAVHEAVCAERYKGITLRLNVALSLLVAILGAAASANPLMAAIQRVFGGG